MSAARRERHCRTQATSNASVRGRYASVKAMMSAAAANDITQTSDAMET